MVGTITNIRSVIIITFSTLVLALGEPTESSCQLLPAHGRRPAEQAMGLEGHRSSLFSSGGYQTSPSGNLSILPGQSEPCSRRFRPGSEDDLPSKSTQELPVRMPGRQ